MRTGSPLPPPSTHLHDQNAHDATRCTGACQVSPRAHLLETNFSRSSYSSGRAGVCGFPSWSPRARICYAATPAGATSKRTTLNQDAHGAHVSTLTHRHFLPAILASRRERASAPRGVRALGSAEGSDVHNARDSCGGKLLKALALRTAPHSHTQTSKRKCQRQIPKHRTNDPRKGPGGRGCAATSASRQWAPRMKSDLGICLCPSTWPT